MKTCPRFLLCLVVACGIPHARRSAAAEGPALVARWDFGPEETTPLTPHGNVHRDVPGPRPPEFPDFDLQNTSVRFDGDGAHFTYADPGAESLFDFTNGDSITLEAWADIETLAKAGNRYIIGKGRTGGADAARDNQNWALRVREIDGRVHVGFLFATHKVQGKKADAHWHRWTSADSFAPGSGWHHLAVTYRFGEPRSIRGWIDGKPGDGAWDLGGETTAAPVVDDDDIWIASSQGGQPGISFRGSLDGIALHRGALPDDVLRARFRREGTSRSEAELPETAPDVADIPSGRVLVTCHELFPAHNRWLRPGETLPPAVARWEAPEFFMPRLPQRYDDWGIRESWRPPVLVRAAADVVLPPGSRRFLVRARGLSRLWVNGTVVLRIGPHYAASVGHEPVDPFPEPPLPGLRSVGFGDQESSGEFEIPEDGKCRIILESIVGGKNFRAEPGEMLVAVQSAVQSSGGHTLALLHPRGESAPSLPLTDADMAIAAARAGDSLTALDDDVRHAAAASQAAFWQKRHALAADWARRHPAPLAPPSVARVATGAAKSSSAPHPIDAFLEEKIVRARADSTGAPDEIAAAPVLDDAAFLRRAALDTIGVPVREDEVRAFLAEPSSEKREKVIDRLLGDERFADHWVSYWQDVLAENPNMLKPSLNNTGPFRWFLYDSLRDNKPFDRLVTELIMLRGSEREGGSAGFGMAADNDAPLAAKGHILATAFLGVELQCARCHDSPFHSTTQKDLFSLAAMLARKPVAVPKTSTVSPGFFEKNKARESLIQVTLPPGEAVVPNFPFAGTIANLNEEELAALVDKPDDPRARLAAFFTAPQNERFAQVVVNRLWKRLIGAGIVEPAHDWEGHAASHPQLLAWLAHEFVAHAYDVKHVLRLILTSQVYLRAGKGSNLTAPPEKRYFAAPDRRRLTAEQIVDSLFEASGRQMDVEEITFDPEGRRQADSMINLGAPSRAWMFATLSNERDRPSLSLPKAQAVTDVLEAFGWTGSRQNPRTDRETDPMILQPGVLANSTLVGWISRAGADTELARLAVDARSPDALVDSVFLRFLGRLPGDSERAPFAGALSKGFSERLFAPAEVQPPTPVKRLGRVSWSNHLAPEATSIMLEMERQARAGTPADPRLRPAWREVYEDFVWSIINTPEFVWLP